ncbi:hypothetical protein P171DRAFT_456641 [Karstenula rhodostoma CBS 690.94]|uniref:Uncharacterized protein n=1 Tax=Karstenula rhodostoma CBS 690.94 TaxID=1392251 RepID=A0A9P4PE18_9PLEO|nr:hypothetical protein P171DRAFT_456641 [Karstenula rhodostoma CBS 690.94]
MPGLKGDANISLVLDQDIVMADDDGSMTITLLSAVDDSVRHVTEVQVSSSVCLKSPYLRTVINVAKDPTDITLGGDLKDSNDGIHKEAALVWLAHIHNLSTERMTELGLDKVSVVAVWEALQMWTHLEKRDNIMDLQDWFNTLYDSAFSKMDLDVYEAGLLAFPCQVFDHAVGFARVTKYLAYHHHGAIKERRPKGIKLKIYHLAPNEFIGPMNHARGGLKSTIHKHMWKKANNLLRFETSRCSCWDATIGQYLAALVKIDAFTIEDALQRSSFQEILDRMKEFTFDYNPACRRCRSIDWVYVVQMTRQAAQGYFDGLCLDCMDRSKPKGKDLDDEYWRINSSVKNRWDSRCRVPHKQATWYVSWLGRDDIRQKLLRGANVNEEED